jgi:hypothetical protein
MARIVVMQLAEMHRVHPQQDNSRVCAECGRQVGIYPSGQAMLKADPSLLVICSRCFEVTPRDIMVLAPGAEHELSESVPARRKGAPHG